MLVAPSRVSKPSVMLEFDTLNRINGVGVAPRELADWLIGRGLHFVSTVEAAEILGVPAASVPASLERSRQAGKLVSVTKGGWVPVPAEYRPVGAPPASHFIDPMMEHLGHSYYVGFLSAAAAHGAAHQSPMVFQVVTPARLRDRRIGRSRIEFIQRAAAAQRPRARRDVPTGRIWVSTPEVTALDLVEAPGEGAGLSNVATIIGEFLLDEVLDADELASVAGAYPTAVAQRAGYLIDRMAAEVGASFDTSPLHGRIGEARQLPLTSGEGASNADPRWRVVAPVPLEHDL